jgi:acetyl esterase
VLRWCLSAVLRASLLLTPRPAALLIRRVFASAGAKTAAGLAKHAPTGVASFVDERYGDDADMLVDIYRPGSAGDPLPLLLWVHGGGWVGGSKEELAGYFKLVASKGYVVAGPRYSLAPEHRYPTPLRQMMLALEFLQIEAGRFHIDSSRIALAGDSAGAQIAAQLGGLVTTPGYSEAVGVAPTITPSQLRGLVLACGPYDLTLARQASSAAGRRFIEAVLWAYTGQRHFLDDEAASASWSITNHVTAAFPPALITVGSVDPIAPHSELLAATLRAHGVEADTLFFPDNHYPPLGHEYQFDLATDAGQLFLERLATFLRERFLAPSPP